MRRFLAIINLMGLCIGVAGGLMLAFSLSLKTSNYRFVETSKHEVWICHDNRVIATGFGGPFVMTDEPCPKGIGPSELPVIETNNDALAYWGLVLVIGGFVFQLPVALYDAFARHEG